MEFAFYLSSAVAVIATLLAVTNVNPVHGLLYLILSLLAVAMVFFALGAPYAGILEVIVYAGAIMVLFVFVVMMLNLGRATVRQEKRWLRPRTWLAPSILAAVLLAELLNLLVADPQLRTASGAEVGVHPVAIALYGPYLLAVELGSMLLLAALIAAYHVGRHDA